MSLQLGALSRSRPKYRAPLHYEQTFSDELLRKAVSYLCTTTELEVKHSVMSMGGRIRVPY